MPTKDNNDQIVLFEALAVSKGRKKKNAIYEGISEDDEIENQENLDPNCDVKKSTKGLQETVPKYKKSKKRSKSKSLSNQQKELEQEQRQQNEENQQQNAPTSIPNADDMDPPSFYETTKDYLTNLEKFHRSIPIDKKITKIIMEIIEIFQEPLPFNMLQDSNVPNSMQHELINILNTVVQEDAHHTYDKTKLAMILLEMFEKNTDSQKYNLVEFDEAQLAQLERKISEVNKRILIIEKLVTWILFLNNSTKVTEKELVLSYNFKNCRKYSEITTDLVRNYHRKFAPKTENSDGHYFNSEEHVNLDDSETFLKETDSQSGSQNNLSKETMQLIENQKENWKLAATAVIKSGILYPELIETYLAKTNISSSLSNMMAETLSELSVKKLQKLKEKVQIPDFQISDNLQSSKSKRIEKSKKGSKGPSKKSSNKSIESQISDRILSLILSLDENDILEVLSKTTISYSDQKPIIKEIMKAYNQVMDDRWSGAQTFLRNSLEEMMEGHKNKRPSLVDRFEKLLEKEKSGILRALKILEEYSDRLKNIDSIVGDE